MRTVGSTMPYYSPRAAKCCRSWLGQSGHRDISMGGSSISARQISAEDAGLEADERKWSSFFPGMMHTHRHSTELPKTRSPSWVKGIAKATGCTGLITWRASSKLYAVHANGNTLQSGSGVNNDSGATAFEQPGHEALCTGTQKPGILPSAVGLALHGEAPFRASLAVASDANRAS